MRTFAILVSMLGLAGVSISQAAPTTINSAGGVGNNLGLNVACTGLCLSPGGPLPASPKANFTINNNIPVSSGWSNPFTGSSWITFLSSQTGTPTPTGQTACGGAPICNNDFVTFYQDFTASGPDLAGTLKVMADDTAAVWINGVLAFAANGPYDPINNTYLTCSNIPVGCLNPTTVGTANFTANNGANRIVFQVYQRDGSGYGLDYQISTVPEPGFYGALALGLSALCFAFRRKRIA
uniref:Ice-binding protein C-terminal domain-containing protein n=1 Tax=Solibacter usitatus (strain Ellin6076) TaxID=234267 RepID=Q01XI8_SOLUE